MNRLTSPLRRRLVALAWLAAGLAPAAWAAVPAPAEPASFTVAQKDTGTAAEPEGTPAAPAPAAPASATNYTFSTGTGASLTNMSSGTTQLVGPGSDDTASAVANIGFDFYFLGTRYTQFSASSNGYVRLGGSAVSGSQYTLGTASVPLITALGSDLIVSSTGKVHYKLLGSAPNRELVVEFLNMTIIYDGAGTSADGTYQVHLHESTGAIDLVYGSMNRNTSLGFQNGDNPQYIGFSTGNTVGTFVAVDTANTPSTSTLTANKFTTGAPMASLTSAADGARRIYTFTPATPTAPTSLSFSGVGIGGMTLNWADSPDESLYAIYVSSDGSNYSFAGNAAQNATSYVASGLAPSTTYFWRVYAVSDGAFSASLDGTQATGAPGNVTSTAAGGPWSQAATWAGGVVPTGADNVTIADGATVTIDTTAAAYSLSVGSGGSPAILEWDSGTARTLSVGSNVSIAANGVFRTPNNGTVTTHALSLAGSLTNNGTLDFSTNGDVAGAGITFTGAANASFGGSGATTDIRSLTLNKGTSNANVLELNPANFSWRGTTTDSTSAAFLTLTNGTLKISGTFSGTARLFGTAGYSIGAGAGLWLNNPNFSVAAQNGSPTLAGLLRVTQGSLNIGTASGNSLGFSSGATVVIEGGTVTAAGRFGVATSTNAISYTQSGGTITVCTLGNTSATLGSFDLGTSLSSAISISGGTIVNQLAATAIDYRHQAGSGIAGVTGGTLQLGNASSGAAKTFNLRGVLPNVVVTSTSAGHTATMSTTLANYNNISLDITIANGATFNANNLVFLFYGTTITNNGTLTHNGASSRFILFRPNTAHQYTGSGTVTAPMTSLELQDDIGLTFDPASPNVVASRVILFTGGFTNANKLTLGNGGTTTATVQIGNTTTPTAAGFFDAAPTFNLGSGGQVVSYLRTTAARSTGPEINPTRTLTSLTVDDNDPSHPLTLSGGDLAVGTALTLANGRVITGASKLAAGTATLTRTNGYVDGNLSKTFTAAGSKAFEVGTANGYSPVTVNATAGSFPGDITVAAAQGTYAGLPQPGKAATRWWTVAAPGATADLSFTYLDPTDLPGTVTEGNLKLYRKDGVNYTDLGATVDTSANTAAAAAVGTFGDFILAEPDALVTPTYTIGGSVSGLTGNGLVLAVTAGSQTVSVPAAATSYVFPTAQPDGSSYTVSVQTQPGGQTCTVANASGTLSGANVTDANVTCATPGKVVISQVYSGGGGSNASTSFKNDYVELFNSGGTAVTLTGWALQYGSATGTGNWSVGALPAGLTIQPGQYLLVREGTAGSAGADLPFTPDATGSLNLGAAAGKVALTSNSTALNGACPTSASIADVVGYGGAGNVNCSETAPVGALAVNTAGFRIDDGCTDTNNNSLDFTINTPVPRYSGSPFKTCTATNPSVSGTATPATVAPGGSVHLAATAVPGGIPTSTGLAVTVDLSSIGGAAATPMFDDGAHNDGAAGDKVFGLDTTVSLATPDGAKSLALSVSDAQSRSGTGSISLTVNSTTPPSISATSATPASVDAGSTTHLAVTVLPGTNPASTSLAVSVDLSSVGGSAGTMMFDDGAHNDGAASDNVFGLDVTVAVATPAGAKSLAVAVSDAQSRSSGGNIALTVTTPVPVVSIGQIQGTGLASPYAGNNNLYRTVGNVVTAVKSNGFVIQDPVGDGNPDTSDGIIVFTGTNSNPAVNVGDVVTVTGKIVEFSGTTEFSGSVTYQVTGTATPIAPIVLDNSLPSPNPTIGFCHGTLPANSPGAGNWECLESMLVSMNGVVTGGTNGGAAADATHPGTPSFFFATVDTQPRPFRESGIAYPGVGGLPVWDGDPELIEFFPSQGYPPAPTSIVVNAGQTFSSTAIVGAYQSGTAPEIYELYPVTFTLTGSAPATVKPVPDAASGTLTVASQNMLHLFNDVADSGSADQCTTQGSKDVCPTTAQFTIRKQKLSLQVRTVLKAPAVIGVQEVENRASLQALADQIHSDDASLTYTPYLIEGNDVGGIDVGFLVRSDVVVSQVTQIGKGTQTTNCSGTPPCLLNDRPPLLLEGTFNGQRFAVLNIHNRSLNNLDTSVYVGPKRLEQAQQVAGIVQGWQTGATQVGVGNAQQDASGTVTTGSFNVVGDVDVPIVVVGDYNAYEFTDGYVDVVGQIKGTAVQADNMYWAAPVTTPTLCDAGLTTDPATRYSFMFDGYVQELDHALVSRRGWRDFVRLDNAHGNADTSEAGPEVTNPATAARSADHDGQVLVLAVDRFFSDGFDSDSCR